MTKHIHVVNGDSSNWKVNVLVQDNIPVYGDDNKIPLSYEWKTVETISLDNPGQLVTRYLTSTRRLVIEENGQ